MRDWRSERGAAAVEFAIVLPILVVVLFAITSFGIALSRTHAYYSAAREASRYAAVHCRPEAITCDNGLIASRVTATANGNPVGPGSPAASLNCTANAGQLVTVSWSQAIPVQIPLLPDMSFTTDISGTFRCE
jgi:Flp pilus assembly protein TadG